MSEIARSIATHKGDPTPFVLTAQLVATEGGDFISLGAMTVRRTATATIAEAADRLGAVGKLKWTASLDSTEAADLLTGDARQVYVVFAGDMVSGAASIAGVSGLVLDGDSIMFGSGIIYGPPAQIADLTGLSVVNQGLPGDTLANIDAAYAANVAPLFSPSTANTVLVEGGINDIVNAAATAADLEGYVQSYAGKALASGYRVAVSTILWYAGLTAPQEAVRDAYNTWLRANYGSFADVLVDFDAEPQLNDAFYFYDTLHPTNIGASVMARRAIVDLGLTKRADVFAEIKNGDWTLSNGDRTALVDSLTGNGATVLTRNVVSSKVVISARLDVRTAEFPVIGMISSEVANNEPLGFNALSVGFYDNGSVWLNSVQLTGTNATFGPGDTVGMVIDFVARLAWMTVDGTEYWGSSTSTDAAGVATGVRGADISGIYDTARTLYASVGAAFTGEGDQWTLVDWPWTMPAGYSRL